MNYTKIFGSYRPNPSRSDTSYTDICQDNRLTLRCNICSMDIEESEIESHINTKEHIENKSRIPPNNGSETKSVVRMWQDSLE